jgi:hypothetical protein
MRVDDKTRRDGVRSALRLLRKRGRRGADAGEIGIAGQLLKPSSDDRVASHRQEIVGLEIGVALVRRGLAEATKDNRFVRTDYYGPNLADITIRTPRHRPRDTGNRCPKCGHMAEPHHHVCKRCKKRLKPSPTMVKQAARGRTGTNNMSIEGS